MTIAWHRLATILTPALTVLAACSAKIVGGGDTPGSGGDGGSTTSTASSSRGGATASSSTYGWSDTTTTVASSSSSSWAASSSGATTTSGDGGGGTACSDPTPESLPAGACTPADAVCNASTSVCLAVADAHGAASFGLRVAHLTMTSPAAFTTGIVQSIFEGYATPDQPQCNLSGPGTFSWLLGFDTAQGTLRTGAAKPASDPTLGYTFVDGPVTLGGVDFSIAPVTLTAPVDAACNVTSSSGDVILPFYGDSTGTLMTLIPVRSLRFLDTRVTPDHNCIGAYDTAGLAPASNCLPDATHASFVDGGQFDGYISLDAADTVLVPPLSETLCVVLSQNASLYGTPEINGVSRCTRDTGNAIVFQGDWCSATNQPATATCADAVRFAGAFAASGILIDG